LPAPLGSGGAGGPPNSGGLAMRIPKALSIGGKTLSTSRPEDGPAGSGSEADAARNAILPPEPSGLATCPPVAQVAWSGPSGRRGDLLPASDPETGAFDPYQADNAALLRHLFGVNVDSD
jgi:hypothetical protein